jgi:sugar lactone lactonase YvrE
MRMGIECLVIALVVLTACARDDGARGWRGSIDTLPNGTVVVRNEGPGLWDSDAAWRVVEDLRIGSADGEGPASFSRIADITADSHGRVYVLEGETQDIRVFDSTGHFIRAVGRRGHGPGEFDQAIGMRWDPRGRLWIVDQGNVRYTVVDTAGRVVVARRRPVSGWFTWRWDGGLDSVGRVYEWYRVPGEMEGGALLRYDTTFTTTDTFPLAAYQGEVFKLEDKSRRVWGSVPYTPNLSWIFDPRGYVWFGISAPYRIFQRRLRGDTVRIIERAYAPMPVTAADRDSAILRLEWFTKQGGHIDASRIPKVKPAFDRFFLDDAGNLWVDPVTARQEDDRVFDVFDPGGRYLGRARSDFSIVGTPVFRGDRLYAATRDENDIPYVVRARIERGARRP